MNNSLYILAIFWGVWLIIPVLFDGTLTMLYMLTILIKNPRRHPKLSKNAILPMVSIIIPTYNEENNINECLNYLKIQNYPHQKMEIIVVDNGSTDRTGDIVKKHIQEIKSNQNLGVNDVRLQSSHKIMIKGRSYQIGAFNGSLTLISLNEQGKSKALNNGIKYSHGQIIINIDCRSLLAPDAITNMVAKFIENPKYGAATGNIEIGWDLIYERDRFGNFLVDETGHYKPRTLTRKEKFLGKAQFMEYLTSFRLGRHFQDLTNSMYTLSGAFSAFRRESLQFSSLYQSRSVSEDTDITLDLSSHNIRIGYAADAKAFLRPVISLEKLYAQRVRWARGEIEVLGIYNRWYDHFRAGVSRTFWHKFMLWVDHTFAFPRLIWTFLLPLFFLFGYSTSLILKAIILMWLFYIFIDFINALFCYFVVDQDTKKKISNSLHYCLVTPIYRLIVYYFRVAAYLDVLKEPPAWSTPFNPLKSLKKLQNSIYLFSRAHGLDKITRHIFPKPSTIPYYEEKIPELDSFGQKPNQSINQLKEEK